MVDELLQAKALKQALIDFVLDAEGELATALETYSAQQLTQQPQMVDFHRREFVVDRFAVEAEVNDRPVIDWFQQQTEVALTEADRALLSRWRNSIMGLFTITQLLPDGWMVMNWTTAKPYRVQLTEAEQQAAQRLQTGDIVLMQLAPLSDSDWFCFGKWISLGKLGKPKLAVAIGNFKNHYPDHLYSDAPDLLAEAWQSVERYHQNFTDFFGAEEVMMSGHQLGKKLAEFQEVMVQQQFAEAGLDQNKSLAELAEDADISAEDLAETAAALGADAKLVTQTLNSRQPAKMVAPNVELPPALKKADQVTVLIDPRWGQVFLTDYATFKTGLESLQTGVLEDARQESLVKLAKKYLERSDIPAFVWFRLAQQYPEPLQALLKIVSNQPDFKLPEDLAALLRQSGKVLQPQLPEIASVPVHLHELFQDAVMEVSKDKSKKKPKAKAGFQR